MAFLPVDDFSSARTGRACALCFGPCWASGWFGPCTLSAEWAVLSEHWTWVLPEHSAPFHGFHASVDYFFGAACHFTVSFLSKMLSARLAVSQAGWWSLILLNLQNGLLILILHLTESCTMQFPSVHPTRRKCLGSNNGVNLESTLGNHHRLRTGK